MARADAHRGGGRRSARRGGLLVLLGTLLVVGSQGLALEESCRVLVDRRCEEPVRAIVAEYARREEVRLDVEAASAAEVARRSRVVEPGCDLLILLADGVDRETPLDELPGARKVAWKHPSGEPVWAAPLGDSALARRLCRFLGGPTGHRLWSESEAGFTMTTGRTRAEAHQWVVENRVAATYAATAERLLRECGELRDGLCVDIGCGSGRLAVELARRSRFHIIGVDIDPDLKTYFDATVHAAELEERVSFVVGDAQKLPFADDSADLIVSRGTLPFIPDIGQCLREVDRVLKPTGVAILGGRYLYTPQEHKLTTERLREIVAASGVERARVVEGRGQWVKILGEHAPAAAAESRGGPDMLAFRFVIDYGVVEGKGLVVHSSDGEMAQALQRGLLERTKLQLVALYPSEKLVAEASARLKAAGLAERVECRLGRVDALPFEDATFDMVAGVGPMLIFGDHERSMREIHRVLRRGGAALVGGRFLHMPEFRRVPSARLREAAASTGLRGIRVLDEDGQWVEVRKGVGEWELAE